MREELLLEGFLYNIEQMDIDPLELDRFMHSFYDPKSNLEDNMELLRLFLYGKI
jgi:hypothetical protein